MAALREDIAAILSADPTWWETEELLRSTGWATFTPRPDRPELFDQQHSFVYNRDLVSFMIGGNASGTTTCAAAKTSKFLLEQQPPPRKDTPFWVVSNTYDMVCGVCWEEKLHGMQLIPDCEVQRDKISWVSERRGWPKSVPLKPWPGRPGKNWTIEFKSFEQGRAAMQARSLGGFWLCEQFPSDIFLEILRGCREYMFPGGQFAEFTPIDPELALWVEKVMDCNTELNRTNLADGWFDAFFGAVSEEMKDTRMTGALASFEGVIYPTFHPAVHVFDGPLDAPRGVQWYRGIDWGASEGHPFVCLLGYKDGMGDWTIVDEYWNNAQNNVVSDHVEAITAMSAKHGWPVRYDARTQRAEQKRDHVFYRQTFADPSRPDMHNEFAKYGIPTMYAINDVYKGIECVRRHLKVRPSTNRPGLRIHARCKHTIEEMRKYRWVKTRKASEYGSSNVGPVARPIPLKRDDDTVDSLRYLLISVASQQGETPDSMSHRDFTKRRPDIGIDTQHQSWRTETTKGAFVRK